MHTILTLHGDSDMAAGISTIVEAAGYRSLYTTDSYQGLSLLLNEPIDLLIQNIARRDMDGFQLYSLLKSESQLRDIPMLIVTGYVAVVTKVELGGRLHGCLHRVKIISGSDSPKSLYVEGCVPVPFHLKELPDTIKPILEKCSRSLLTEEERTLRYQQLWSQTPW